MPELPVPLVAAEVDLRGYPFLPLQVRRLRDSDLLGTSTAEGFRAAIVLWCVAWHELPAASLPDDDRALAGKLPLGSAPWPEIRAEALRGWIKCSDGRLYHPVLADAANRAWDRFQGNRERTRAATEARLKRSAAQAVGRQVRPGYPQDYPQRNETRNVQRNEDVTSNVTSTNRDRDINPPYPPLSSRQRNVDKTRKLIDEQREHAAKAVPPPGGSAADFAKQAIRKLPPFTAKAPEPEPAEEFEDEPDEPPQPKPHPLGAQPDQERIRTGAAAAAPPADPKAANGSGDIDKRAEVLGMERLPLESDADLESRISARLQLG